MAYDPQIHIPIDKPLGIAQAIPSDARSYYYDAVLFKYRPYQSTVEANTYLNVAKFRKGHFTLFINIGGVLELDGSFTGGVVTEYWYRDGVTNGDLISKAAGSVADLSKIKRYPIFTAGEAFLQNNEWIQAELLSGTRNGSEVFLDDDIGFEALTDTFTFDPVLGKLTPNATVPIGPEERFRLTFKNINI